MSTPVTGLYRTASSYGCPELFKRDLETTDIATEILSNPDTSSRRAKEVCKQMSARNLVDPKTVEKLKNALDKNKAEEDLISAQEDAERLAALQSSDAMPKDLLKVVNQFAGRFVL
jgi:hypothetical protein